MEGKIENEVGHLEQIVMATPQWILSGLLLYVEVELLPSTASGSHSGLRRVGVEGTTHVDETQGHA